MGSFLLTPPCKNELISDWLNFTRARVKTLRRLLFRISIMVWVGVKSAGGVNRKDKLTEKKEQIFGFQYY